MKTNTHFVITRSVLLRTRDISGEVVEEIKTHVLCSVTIFFFENSAVYEIMWKNIVERGRPQMTIWRMRILCLVPKATNTHSEYVILIFFSTATLVNTERASMLRYTFIACLATWLSRVLF
jgi:hypothetical protein